MISGTRVTSLGLIGSLSLHIGSPHSERSDWTFITLNDLNVDSVLTSLRPCAHSCLSRNGLCGAK